MFKLLRICQVSVCCGSTGNILRTTTSRDKHTKWTSADLHVASHSDRTHTHTHTHTHAHLRTEHVCSGTWTEIIECLAQWIVGAFCLWSITSFEKITAACTTGSLIFIRQTESRPTPLGSTKQGQFSVLLKCETTWSFNRFNQMLITSKLHLEFLNWFSSFQADKGLIYIYSFERCFCSEWRANGVNSK